VLHKDAAMPVLLSGSAGYRVFSPAQPTHRLPSRALLKKEGPFIDLGLVNNMSDGALHTTERQVLKLLDSAAGDLTVRLRLYSLTDFPRTALGERHLERMHYFDQDDLWQSALDGVIITGTEPRAPDLVQEPYWNTLTEVFDWAGETTRSTICSCLAVHAAVRHLDGIDRRPLEDKCFGVFEFENASNHFLMSGVSPSFRMPHSRWNEVTERDLERCGYTILSRSENQGVDAFAKQNGSLYIFFQGHPEYEPWTLLSEYRRDVERFLRGERAAYPSMPAGCLDDTAVKAFKSLREQALQHRDVEVLADVDVGQFAKGLTDPWRSEAASIYRNWLEYLYAQKVQRYEYIEPVRSEPTLNTRR
jgi:homoserine O-succinyltransferase/O-acetyltransferase